MLSKLKIKNYKSIQDLSLDLSYDESAPNNYRGLPFIPFVNNTSKKDSRLVPVMNIYGANASGKSTLIQAFAAFKAVLSNGVRTGREFVFPNKIRDLGDYTKIEIDFYIEKKLYKYFVSYSDNAIVEEVLSHQKELIFSITKDSVSFDGLSSSLYSEKDLKNIFTTSCTSAEDGGQIKLFLSGIIKDKPGLSKELIRIHDFLSNKIQVFTSNQIIPQQGIDALSPSKQKEDIDEAVSRIGEHIKRFDIDIEGFQFEFEELNLDKYKTESGLHFDIQDKRDVMEIDVGRNLVRKSQLKTSRKDLNGDVQVFGMQHESGGTNRLFGLIGMVLKTLDTGGVLIIDELDASLHSFVLKSLIRMFKQRDLNINNSQIISTLHNTDILDDSIYRTSEFAFINKNKKDGSSLKKMSEYEGIRNESKFRDKYMKGFFYGIPYLEI